MKKLTTILFLASFAITMAGCSSIGGSKGKKDKIQDTDLVGASYTAADSMMQGAPELRAYQNKPILVASFVDVDDVQRSSTFGRMIAEQVGSRFAQAGYKGIEVKVRTDSIFTKGNAYSSEGEYLLSRELQDISRSHDAYALIVGTYGDSREVVYVTTKLVRAADNIIMSSYDYSMPIGDNTRAMLRTSKRR